MATAQVESGATNFLKAANSPLAGHVDDWRTPKSSLGEYKVSPQIWASSASGALIWCVIDDLMSIVQLKTYTVENIVAACNDSLKAIPSCHER